MELHWELMLILISGSLAGGNQVYKVIWQDFSGINQSLAEYNDAVLDYTRGRPRYIPLWRMQNARFRKCYYQGFPNTFDLSTVFQNGSKILLWNSRRLVTVVGRASNLGLVDYLLTRDGPSWQDTERSKPLYHLARLINVYRYLYRLHNVNSSSITGTFVRFLVDYEELMFLYTFLLCRVLGSGSDDYDGICPRLCGGKDICGALKHGVPQSCSLVDRGVMENQYRCRCRYGYSWSHRIMKCVSSQAAACTVLEMARFCDSTHTVNCNIDPSVGYPSCNCRHDYYGDRCELPPSICIHFGNQACLVRMGGACNDLANGTKYRCVCPVSHSNDARIWYPNCLLQKTRPPPCISGVRYCRNGGVCEHKSQTLSEAYICRCPVGFMGRHCEFPLGLWTDWSSWSISCSPHYGPTRFQMRYRSCLGNTDCGKQDPQRHQRRRCVSGASAPSYTHDINSSLFSLLFPQSTQQVTTAAGLSSSTRWFSPRLALRYTGIIVCIEAALVILLAGLTLGLLWLLWLLRVTISGLVSLVRLCCPGR